MKLVIRISSIILLLLLMLVPTIAVSLDQKDQKYPEFINGESVIFVQNSENTFSLDSSDVVLTILDDSSSIEESMTKFSDYLSNHQLPKGWSITVLGGPGASKEEYLQVHNSFNDAVEKNGGPFKLQQQSLGRTYAICAPTDPSSETIRYIAAEWLAPQVGNNQNQYSAMLVNGWTDQSCTDPNGNPWSGYFLQSGQLYVAGLGFHVWADTTTSFQAQDWGVPYVAGHECWYAIAWFASGWSMAMSDQNTGGWVWHWEPAAVGTRLVESNDTSVFFENWNTNDNWEQGFTSPISVFNAYDGMSYPLSIHPWNNDYIYIQDTFGNKISNGWWFWSTIRGRLRNLGTANWNLWRIPLAQ